MIERIQRLGLFVKSVLFATVIHGILLAILLVGQWSFSEQSIEPGTTEPIQAQVISTDYIQQKKAAKLAQEKKRLATEKKRKQEAEKKRLATEKKRKQEAEKKRLATEKKRKQEVEKKRLAAEKKRKQEAEKKRLEAEKQRKEEAEKKQLEAEKQRKVEAEKKRLKAERLKREQELKAELAKERILQQQAQTKLDAATALNALVGRIKAAVENNWRRPLHSATGLEVTIAVKVSRNGAVLSANVVKSSGDRFFDQSAELAVKKASPLPFPSDPKYYEFIAEFNIKFNPDE